MSTDEVKVYELTFSNSTAIRISIPADYKVTYGPVVGANSKSAYGTGMTFRVWESDKLQRGLWSDVTSFRDMSIPLLVKAVRFYGQADDTWHIDDGTYVGPRAALVEKGWRDEGDIKPLPEEHEDPTRPIAIGGRATRTALKEF